MKWIKKIYHLDRGCLLYTSFLKKEKGKVKKEIKSINISLANFSRKKEALSSDKKKIDVRCV